MVDASLPLSTPTLVTAASPLRPAATTAVLHSWVPAHIGSGSCSVVETSLASSWSKLLLCSGFLSPVSSGTSLLLFPFSSVLCDINLEFSTTGARVNAEAEAAGFVWPPEVLTRDASALVAAGGSLSALVSARQSLSAENRFNVARCRKIFSNDIDFPILLEVASFGATVDVSGDFVLNGSPEPLRQLHGSMLHTFQKHAFKLWQKNQVFLLPLAALTDTTVHYSSLHWTPKPGKPEGRFLGDLSNNTAGSSVNSDDARAAIVERFGEAPLPSISDIVGHIFEVADSCGGLANVSLWKEDIVGAFGQFNINPDSSHLLAFLVDAITVLIYFTGMFGWMGAPFVFNVFSRALGRVANARSVGSVDIYVDDFMGASPTPHALADQHSAQLLITEVFGPSSVNLEKTILPAREAEFIGWFIHLPSETIRPSDRGIRKLAFAFFGVDISAGVSISVQVYQRLASLAGRYSVCLIGMRAFVQPLFQMLRGTSTSRKPSAAAKFTIIIWRSVSLILLADPVLLAVPLSSLRSLRDVAVLRVKSDAGPRGLGVVIYDLSGTCLAHVSYFLPFNAGDPSFQNIREFLGLLFGLLLLTKLGYNRISISWTGDNVSSLSWARKNLSSSPAAQASFYFYSWLQIKTQIDVVETIHVPGITMGDVDGLSRFRATGFSKSTDVSYLICPIIKEIMVLCDPTLPRNDLREHESLFSDVLRLIEALCSSVSAQASNASVN